MPHAPGTVLIHPSHGPMRVVSTTSRRFPNGVSHDCLNLEALDSHTLAVTIPVDRYAASGLRDVVAGDAFDELFGTLRDATSDESENWSRRYKANEQKVRSGSVLSLAEVVRDLLRRNKANPLSLGERSTLMKGMGQLALEVFYAMDLESVDSAKQKIKDAALGIQPSL